MNAWARSVIEYERIVTRELGQDSDRITCPECGGTGEADQGPCSPVVKCPLCNGTGWVPRPVVDCPRGGSMPSHTEYQRFKNIPALTGPKPLELTGHDIEGPFYKAGAPPWHHPEAEGPSFKLRGRVLDTAGNPVACVMDWWQADATGTYDNDGYNLRGKLFIDPFGHYLLPTIRPGDYKISGPGEPDEFRCSHLHVKIWIDHREVLITQIYFKDGEYDDTDHWFDAKRAVDSPEGTFDFVVER